MVNNLKISEKIGMVKKVCRKQEKCARLQKQKFC